MFLSHRDPRGLARIGGPGWTCAPRTRNGPVLLTPRRPADTPVTATSVWGNSVPVHSDMAPWGEECWAVCDKSKPAAHPGWRLRTITARGWVLPRICLSAAKLCRGAILGAHSAFLQAWAARHLTVFQA